jgi:serine-type D-Ala-D-Ala carboxypeptidase (penicillin-binding protein 5/6)
VLFLLAVALVWRMASERTPTPTIRSTLPAYIRLPGITPSLAWPRAGQAAVEVERVGSLGTSGRSAAVPIASVAKVMTAYLTLIEYPLAVGEEGFSMTITAADVAEESERVALGESTLSVRAGERISERQALEALLLPSANNVAALLAAHASGGTAEFVRRMNSTARELGMTSTTYTDPSGFDATTVSTATDQLKLARAAMRQPTFAAIVAESSARLPVAGRVVNVNALAGREGYVGVKTGSDSSAGGCLMFAKQVKVGGRRWTVLGVVLGQRQGAFVEAALTSARRLGDSVAAALRVETVLPAGTSALIAHSADGQSTVAATGKALRAVGWPGLTLAVQVVARVPVAQLRRGERMATVTVRGAGSATTYASATRPLTSPSLSWRVEHLL